MSPLQKYAWFNLAVVAVTLLLIVALLPFLGYRAMGGLGCLGFLGFGYIFIRPRSGQVVTDERDALIQRRSMIVAYSLFWVVFALVAVFLPPLCYGEHGAVPVSVVQLSVAAAWILVQTVSSLAILVQYAGGAVHAE